MKKTILITLMVMLTLTIGAQNAAQARKVLDKTAAVVSNKNGATAQFTLSSAKTGTVSGRLSLKGNKFQVTTPHSIIWYNGKTQWSYLKSTEEVNMSTPTAAQQLQMNPYRFINMYKTGYNLGLRVVVAADCNRFRKQFVTLLHPYQPLSGFNCRSWIIH